MVSFGKATRGNRLMKWYDAYSRFKCSAKIIIDARPWSLYGNIKQGFAWLFVRYGILKNIISIGLEKQVELDQEAEEVTNNSQAQDNIRLLLQGLQE